MVGTLTLVALVPVVCWLVPFVHVLGHYYTARQIVGVPGTAIRLVNLRLPRYLALRDDDGWVGPHEFERYRAAYETHDPGYEHFERFVAGGEIIQTLLVVPTAALLAISGFERVGGLVLVVSLLTTFLFVTQDAIRTRRVDGPAGDYSALWGISPRIPGIFLVGFLFVHLTGFYFVV
jgi:hypothetical protein